MNGTARRAFLAALLALSLSVVAAAEALGAKAGATITLSDPTPSWGDTITITVSEVETRQPYVLVYVRCETDSALIYISGGTANELEPTATLMSLAWLGGPASCEVLVVETRDGSRARVIASLAFEVLE